MLTQTILDDALRTAAGLKELSAPSVVMVKSVAAAVAPILASAAGDVAGRISSSVADAVGGLASAVPVLGMFVGIATGFISWANALQAEDAAKQQAECKSFLSIRKIVPSGSKLGGCEQCPCDLFRTVHIPGLIPMRSVLGQALVAITEGEDFGELNLMPTRPSDDSYSRNRRALIRQLTGAGPDDKRVKQYRSLRVAMERSYVDPDSASTSSGGVEFWTSYLDMLLRDVESGVITKQYADWSIWSLYHPPVGGGKYWSHPRYLPSEQYIGKKDSFGNPLAQFSPRGNPKGFLSFGTSERRCFDPWLRESIFSMVDQWRNTVRPRYDEGKKALAEIEALARTYRNKQGGLIGACLLYTSDAADEFR
ncbi:MAG: hypothetical protein QUS11_03505, partial [Candidatus Fermentibacter sp.]|nr:hypothetical protein [Candidatus Fermentibacter sp.]